VDLPYRVSACIGNLDYFCYQTMNDIQQAETKTNKRSLTNILVWIVMAILAGGTAAWVVWASRQPEVPSMWAPQ